MDLMSQGQKRGPDFITGFTVTVENIIAVCPGKNTLFDVQLHGKSPLFQKNTIQPAALQEKYTKKGGQRRRGALLDGYITMW
jgi:hypothetical protein